MEKQTAYSSGIFINIDDGIEVTGGTVSEEDSRLLTASSDNKVTVEHTEYSYTTQRYFENETIFKMLFKNAADTDTKIFWLASRCVDLCSDYCSFDVRLVYRDFVSSSYLFYTDGKGYSSSYSVVPIVSLESNILTTGKDESGEWNLKVD